MSDTAPFGRPMPHGKRFYYLVANGVDEPPTTDEIQHFFRLGSNTGKDYVFIFIDIANDNRLEQALSRIEGGVEFYINMKRTCPVFLFTERQIETNLRDIARIEMYPIRDYNTDISSIYERLGQENPRAQKRFINFLSWLNRYAKLEPNFHGIGISLNKVIEDLIDRQKRQI